MKILVISSNLIGDTILSTGVIQFFLNKYINSKFTFVIGPTASQLYDHFPNLEKRIIVQKKKYNLHWFKIIKSCFFTKWDIIIDFRSSMISYVLFHRKKFIFKKNNISHHLDQLTNFFKFDCFNLKIHTSDKEVKEVEKTISKQFKHVVICPGGNWKPKLWGVKNFVKLMKNIKQDYSNVKFLIVGSLIEKKYYFQDVVNEINKNDIIDLMGASLTLTSAYMKKSDLFIGNDSGLMHLSSASNLATIGLFGPTDDKIYAPKGISCFVVRTKEDYEYFKKNICEPNKSYMQSINEESIIGLIQKNKLL